MGEEYEEMVSPGASLSAAERTATKASAASVAEPRAPWEPIGFVLDGEDWEPGEVGFILKTDGQGVTITDLRKAAAAPEMLEALGAAANELEWQLERGNGNAVTRAALSITRAAIAKATGEQP